MHRLSVAIGCALFLVGCAGEPANTAVSSSSNHAPLPPARMPADSLAPAPSTSQPTYRVRGAPVYPGFEAVYGIEGTTWLLILVGKDGGPLDIKVEHSSGSRDLDKSALTAAIQWRFNPRMQNGVAADGYVRVPVAYGATFKDLPPWPSAYASAPINVDGAAIPYGTVQEAVVGVAARAHEPLYTGTDTQFHVYVIYDDKQVVRERWYFTDISTDRAMAIRYTFAGTADHPVTKVATLCDNTNLCQRRMQQVLIGPSSMRSSNLVSDQR
jgi:TonB family protein